DYESTMTVTYDDEYYVILPSIHIDGLKAYYKDYQPINLEEYNSGQSLMDKEELRKMLKKGGFI
ncbi:hypothetical protein K4G98_24955, partial [Mycobacterium tuberculosis]|nr:hypothetical protein [Mycobacterium tuberculosis]